MQMLQYHNIFADFLFIWAYYNYKEKMDDISDELVKKGIDEEFHC